MRLLFVIQDGKGWLWAGLALIIQNGLVCANLLTLETNSAFQSPEYVNPRDFRYAFSASQVHFSKAVVSAAGETRVDLVAAVSAPHSAIVHKLRMCMEFNPSKLS